MSCFIVSLQTTFHGLPCLAIIQLALSQPSTSCKDGDKYRGFFSLHLTPDYAMTYLLYPTVIHMMTESTRIAYSHVNWCCILCVHREQLGKIARNPYIPTDISIAPCKFTCCISCTWQRLSTICKHLVDVRPMAGTEEGLKCLPWDLCRKHSIPHSKICKNESKVSDKPNMKRLI